MIVTLTFYVQASMILCVVFFNGTHGILQPYWLYF